MRFTKTIRRTAAVSFVAAVLALGATTSAQAAEGTWTVSASGGCVALQKVAYWSGHDHMVIDPITNDGTCEFGIYDFTNGYWVYGPTSSGAESPWVSDAGVTLAACVASSETGWGWHCPYPN